MEEEQGASCLSTIDVEKSIYPRISVVIPARNEAQNLYHVLPYIPSIVEEIILIDGHSSDNTIAVAQQLLPSISIVEQPGRGKGDALCAGFAACTGDIIVMLDADGSADPAEIPRFIEALVAGHDFAKGSRFIKGGGSHDITGIRRAGNYLLSILVNILFLTRFSDLCYGYNAFWRYCLEGVTINCDGFEIETLINLQMHKAKFKIVEVPSFEHPRIYGKSNLRTFQDGWRILKTILKEWRRKGQVLMVENRKPRVCVIGPGKRFLSGMSYYTLHLANALAQSDRVSVMLMRQLLPTLFYPGRKRVGAKLTKLEYDASVKVFDGIDWHWIPSIFRSLAFLVQECPDEVIFQWWTGTVLHSYLLIALVARLLKSKVVIEFHEVLDTGEAKLPIAQIYVRLIAPLIVRLAHGFVVHSEFDRELIKRHYDLQERPIALIPHGPYHYYQEIAHEKKYREVPTFYCNLLFFGVIRPYKGLEDLIMAFNALPKSEIYKYRLTVVGETWEGWDKPKALIEQSQYHDRITFVNRYVTDTEVMQFFAEANAVVLPYHRSSTSGPLHIAMSCGLPVVVTRVGGLVEAVEKYDGAILVPPKDIHVLRDALLQVVNLCDRRYSNPCSWEHTTNSYHTLFDAFRASSDAIQVTSKGLSLVSQYVQQRELTKH